MVLFFGAFLVLFLAVPLAVPLAVALPWALAFALLLARPDCADGALRGAVPLAVPLPLAFTFALFAAHIAHFETHPALDSVHFCPLSLSICCPHSVSQSFLPTMSQRPPVVVVARCPPSVCRFMSRPEAVPFLFFVLLG